MRAGAALAAMIAFASPAFALQAPSPGREDPNVKIVAYSPMQRTLIVSSVNRLVSITYAPTERIARIAFGSDGILNGPNPDDLKSQPLLNNISMWAVKTGHTMMQIITTLPGGAERLYQYDVTVREDTGHDDPDLTYGLIYTYPRDAHEEAATAAKVRYEARVEAIAKARLATDVFYGERNWKYTAQGKDAWLAPDEVSDNGNLTAFKWNGNRPKPSIFIVGKGPKDEDMAHFSQRGPFTIVSDPVACHYRLRMEQGGTTGVLDIFNKSKNCGGAGYQPETGTSSPEVIREVRR